MRFSDGDVIYRDGNLIGRVRSQEIHKIHPSGPGGNLKTDKGGGGGSLFYSYFKK